MRPLAFSFVLLAIALLNSCQTSPYDSYAAWEQQQPRYNARQQAAYQRTAVAPRSAWQNKLVPANPLRKPTRPAPKPDCAAVCVIDPRTGNVIYQHNAHTRRQVASTQKIMTALCVTDAGRMNRMVTIMPEDGEGVPPIKLNLKPGTRYSRADLLKVMLTGSYNDVARTLARDTAGSVEAFVGRMNARARRMRMYDSRFANPNGLPAEQYSTAYDMALAACYAYNNPIIRSCINIPEYTFRTTDGKAIPIKSTNKLLKEYPWVQGMKTGYTKAAGKCLISCASMRGQSVIVVVLGSTTPKVWDESLKYLRWAFNMPPSAGRA